MCVETFFSLNPTLTTPGGRVVTFVSWDCCPYLDDYEPNYSPAAPAVVQSKSNETLRKTVTWDPRGPQYDEPKPYQETKKRRAAPPTRWPANDSNSSVPPTGWTATDTDSDSSVHSQEWSTNDYSDVGATANTQIWTTVGRFNPIPVKLNKSGSNDILRRLLDVEMARSARQAVTGDGICIGLAYETNAFVQPKTVRSKEFTKLIVDEVRSHEELQNNRFTSIQINHNTIGAPHTDNNLKGFPSIAIGLGDYVGGRLRIAGAKQPLHIRDHAVVFDGLETHSSGKFNGDWWSLVLFVHTSSEAISHDIAKINK